MSREFIKNTKNSLKMFDSENSESENKEAWVHEQLPKRKKVLKSRRERDESSSGKSRSNSSEGSDTEERQRESVKELSKQAQNQRKEELETIIQTAAAKKYLNKVKQESENMAKIEVTEQLTKEVESAVEKITSEIDETDTVEVSDISKVSLLYKQARVLSDKLKDSEMEVRRLNDDKRVMNEKMERYSKIVEEVTDMKKRLLSDQELAVNSMVSMLPMLKREYMTENTMLIKTQLLGLKNDIEINQNDNKCLNVTCEAILGNQNAIVRMQSLMNNLVAEQMYQIEELMKRSDHKLNVAVEEIVAVGRSAETFAMTPITESDILMKIEQTVVQKLDMFKEGFEYGSRDNTLVMRTNSPKRDKIFLDSLVGNNIVEKFSDFNDRVRKQTENVLSGLNVWF